MRCLDHPEYFFYLLKSTYWNEILLNVSKNFARKQEVDPPTRRAKYDTCLRTENDLDQSDAWNIGQHVLNGGPEVWNI